MDFPRFSHGYFNLFHLPNWIFANSENLANQFEQKIEKTSQTNDKLDRIVLADGKILDAKALKKEEKIIEKGDQTLIAKDHYQKAVQKIQEAAIDTTKKVSNQYPSDPTIQKCLVNFEKEIKNNTETSEFEKNVNNKIADLLDVSPYFNRLMKIFKTYDDALVRAGANALISNDLGIDSALDLGTRLKEKKVVGINLSKTP
ncbi:MAG TPA: hypothetical protein PLQ36_04220, partial [Candidatus Gracilibacteria bacterium]|nr:hypothetical protein [Candidatus Gracilibacteria bacterium]